MKRPVRSNPLDGPHSETVRRFHGFTTGTLLVTKGRDRVYQCSEGADQDRWLTRRPLNV
jgi:hypothetical protein